MRAAYIALVRWAFTRLYREFAWAYDVVAWLVSRGLWRRWALSALPYLHGRVLELGCGTGYVQEALAAAGWAALGIDASPQMIALSARRLERAGRSSRLVRGLAQQLPFGARSFDTVLATFPAEYIVDPATATEVARVLAPGGRIVVVDGAAFNNDGLYERLVDLAYRLTMQMSTRPQPSTKPSVDLATLGWGELYFDAQRVRVGPSEVLVLVGRKSEV